jgi:hypothetical protein
MSHEHQTNALECMAGLYFILAPASLIPYNCVTREGLDLSGFETCEQRKGKRCYPTFAGVSGTLTTFSAAAKVISMGGIDFPDHGDPP